MRRVCPLTLRLLAGLAGRAAAQEPLTLARTMAEARAAQPCRPRGSRRASRKLPPACRQAQAGWLPRVDFAESVQRGNMPVYVFGSLLSQRRFTEANFAVDALNHPDPLTNHRASLMLQHALFDSDVQTAVRTARVGRDLASVAREVTDRDLALDATTRVRARRSTAAAAYRASQAAVAAAEEDARRTRDRRDAGLVTEADVLALDVHLARMKARAIDADASGASRWPRSTARWAEPLDREYVLESPAPVRRAPDTLAALEDAALPARPEARQAALQEHLARVQHDGARQALPAAARMAGRVRVERRGLHGPGRRLDRGRGGAPERVPRACAIARGVAEAAHRPIERAVAERALAGVRHPARRAERVAAARGGTRAASPLAAQPWRRPARASASSATATRAGLAGVSDVLRAAEALLDAETTADLAQVDVVIEAAALDRAVGR